VALYLQEKPEEALVHLEKLPAASVKDTEVGLLWTRLYLEQGKQKAARESLERITDLESAEVALLRGRLLLEEGRRVEARGEFVRALAAEASSVEAWDSLAAMWQGGETSLEGLLGEMSYLHQNSERPGLVRSFVESTLPAEEPAVSAWLAQHNAG
jgi:predicted Zn-dependent protease